MGEDEMQEMGEDEMMSGEGEESELEEVVSTSWTTVTPKVKSVKGNNTKGKNSKDGKRNDSKEKKRKIAQAKAKLNHVVFFHGPKKVARIDNIVQGTTGC